MHGIHIVRLVLTAVCLGACGGAAAQASAALTLGGAFDTAGGRGYDVDGWFAPDEHWSLGAGIGRSDSDASGTAFSGQSLRLNGDVGFGPFLLGLSTSRWKDPDRLRSVSTQATLSWIAASGLSVGALADDRRLRVYYQAGTSDARIDFSGRGYGAELFWFGQSWTSGVRFLDYSYGPSLDRLHAVMDSEQTAAFPRMQALVDSIVTRAAGAPARELSLSLGRRLARSSLRGEWLLLRDAVTRSDVHSLLLRHGYRFTPRLELATTVGFSTGGEFESVGFGGLALTLSSASP